MKNFKMFIKIFLVMIVFFFIYNVLAWKFITGDLMSINDNKKNYSNGDLARLSYMPLYNIKKKNYTSLPHKHIELTDYTNQKIDIITFGDSYSNGLMGGKNPFYQDYISSYSGLNVLNIKILKIPGDEYLNTVIGLINSGIIDKINPKIIILESVECEAVRRYSVNVDFDKKLKYNNLESFRNFLYAKNNRPLNFIEFIINANYKILYNWILYNLSDNASSSLACINNINTNLFTTKYDKTLMFYKLDVNLIKFNSDKSNLNKVNNNLNLLADKLAAKGIKLYFMPCVDKYDLYSKFITNNKYPQSQFFENLRSLPKKYTFIDTKAILSKEVDKGVKDIYYFDDTHWSWKASEAIFKQVKFN